METNRCAFCGTQGVLVKLTAARSDTEEELNVEFICPECFYDCLLEEVFSIGVVVKDDEGTAYVAGRGPEEGP